MTRTPPLTPALTRKIVKKITEGIPSEVAARLCGVSLDVFAGWVMRGEGKDPDRRATPRFKAFAQAIDQAEAQAVARKVTDINRAIKNGRISAARWWLERRSSYFAAPRPGIAVGGDLNLTTTLIQQINAVKAESAAMQDPRLALEAKQQEALPEPRLELEEQPQQFVPDARQQEFGRGVIDMIALPGA